MELFSGFSRESYGEISRQYDIAYITYCYFYRHGRPKTDRRRLATDSFDFDLMVSEEKRLTKFLYQRYSRLGRGGRPVMNSSQVVLVRFGLAMIQMDLDERQNMLTSSDWCRYVSTIDVVNSNFENILKFSLIGERQTWWTYWLTTDLTSLISFSKWWYFLPLCAIKSDNKTNYELLLMWLNCIDISMYR